MTNGDRIRQMSDEELAVMFAKLKAVDALYRLGLGVQNYQGRDVNDAYDWLTEILD